MSIDEKTIGSLVAFQKVLAHAMRLKLIGMCSLELAQDLKVGAPTVSHRINKVKGLNLLRSVPGKQHYLLLA